MLVAVCLTVVTNYRYILGPPSMKDESNLGKIPRVYINTDTQTEDCLLLVYRALSAAVCLVLEGESYRTGTSLLCRKRRHICYMCIVHTIQGQPSNVAIYAISALFRGCG